MNPSFYGIPGHTHTMIHEIGHSLGLYHIFRGISEIQSCSDPCMETEPSFETGDLCSDTNPAPKHKFCGDPGPGNDTCGFNSFFNTPYNNFMSYAGKANTLQGARGWVSHVASGPGSEKPRASCLPFLRFLHPNNSSSQIIKIIFLP